MSNHAGYGASAVVRQPVIQDVLTILHRAGQLPSQFAGEEPIEDPDRAGATEPTRIAWNLFLREPRIELRATDAPFVALGLQLAGELRLLRPGSAAQRFPVVIEGRIRVVAEPVNNGGTLQIGLRLPALLVDAYTIRTSSVPEMPEWLRTGLTSRTTRLVVQEQLRTSMAAQTAMTPALLGQVVSQLGVLGLRLAETHVKVLDGAVAVGVSLQGDSPTSTFALRGSAERLTDYCPRFANLAVSIHPEVARLLFQLTRGQIEVQARTRSNTIVEELRLELEDGERGEEGGHLRVTGAAVHLGQRARFELLVKPRIDETRVHLYLHRFAITELPWPLYYLGVLASGLLTPFGVIGVFSAVFRPIHASIVPLLSATVRNAASLDRTISATLPGTASPALAFRAESLGVDAGGLHAALRVTPSWSRGVRIEGPTRIGPTEPSQVVYVLTGAEPLFHPRDPRVRIWWQVRRLDNGRVLLQLDSEARRSERHACAFHVGSSDAIPARRFEVSCRVYRAPATSGEPAEELYRGSVTVVVDDPLDRSHPYVRWRHEVFVPEVEVQIDSAGRQVRRTVGYMEVQRRSRIHRTAVPGRCRFAHRFSPHVLQRPDPRQPEAPSLEYLDELPFPRARLAAHRGQLCDYCFFGGPTSSTPLI